jgi:hypothetical protein
MENYMPLRFLLLIMLILCVVPLVQAQDLEQDEAAALEVIARINDWRLEAGVWPLKPNPILTEMALDQARYIVSLADLPDDLHIGRRGLQPRQRALAFNWPHYQLPGQIAIGENAAIGNVSFALRFWQNSALHSSTALNPAYREIGAAALPYRDELFFIAVFGSRPDVLPTLLDPRDNRTLYLANEEFDQARFFDSIQSVTQVLIFDADGKPVWDAPVDWEGLVILPENVGDAVYLLLTDGEHEVISPVSLSTDRIILPDFLPPPVVVAAEPTAQPTATPTVTPEPPEPEVSTSEPTAAATSTPEATPTPTTAAQPDLRIIYSDDTLDVLNISGNTVDWRALSLVGTIDFPFAQWQRVADFPLDALPANHCLQIRSNTITSEVILPESCRWVRSLIEINPQRLFWTQGPFEVRRNGATLATCESDAGVCEVVLD